MARKSDSDGGFDQFGNLSDPTQNWWDPPTPDPTQTGGGSGSGQGVTDPSVKSATPPDPNSPEEIARLNGIYGPGGTAMTRPSPTATWDPQKEAWNPETTPTTTTGGGDADLRAQIAKWAAMQGADPSLSGNPDYWVDAINKRGGLNAGNTQYWQDASVGPNAFFNNPGREGTSAPPAAGGGGATSGGNLRDLLTQLIMGGKDPASTQQRQALQDRLNGMMDAYGKPVTADDPLIHNASDAYGGDVQRSIASFREQAAERAHAQGVPTGAFDAQIGNAVQAGGRATGKFTTDLIGQETNTRRNLLAQAMGQSASLANDSDNTALRGKSLDLSSILGQEGVDNQDSQFYDNLTSNMSSHANDLDTILQELLLK